MTLNLVKGEFSSLEEALRAQVQRMEAELTELKTHNKLMLDMVAKRDTKIQDLEILVEGHRESIREYKLELKQLETPINFDDDDDDE